MLARQTHAPAEILVVDSTSTDGTPEIAAACPKVRVIPIERKDFDHGGSRSMAARQARGDILDRELLQTLGIGRLVGRMLGLDRRVFGLGNLLGGHTAVLLVETIEIVGKVLFGHTGNIVTGNTGNA